MRSNPALNLVRSLSARMFTVLAFTAVLVSPAGALSVDHGHEGPHAKGNTAVDRPVWLDKLENQLNHEDTIENGRVIMYQ
jgi:hypothetical protein